MSATRRRRGRPETPWADIGPSVRYANGTAVLTYRVDPDRPAAPAIRAAKALVAFEALPLSPSQLAAANRIRAACEAVAGAREFNGGGLGGRAYWQCGGPTPAMVQAATDLREVGQVLGPAHERAVLLLIVNGVVGDLPVLQGALETMGAWWGV